MKKSTAALVICFLAFTSLVFTVYAEENNLVETARKSNQVTLSPDSRDSYILGNTTGEIATFTVAKGLTIESIKVTFSNPDVPIEEVILKEGDVVLGEEIQTNGEAKFYDGFELESGNFTVSIKASEIGKDEAGFIASNLFMTLEITFKDEDGNESVKVVETPFFSIVPTRISHVEFVTACGGNSVASSLVNGSNLVAILKITTDASTNTALLDGTYLETLLTNAPFSFLGAAAEYIVGGKVEGEIYINNGSYSCFCIFVEIEGLPKEKKVALRTMVDLSNIEYRSDDFEGNEIGVAARKGLRLPDYFLKSEKIYQQ